MVPEQKTLTLIKEVMKKFMPGTDKAISALYQG
jgi:hypothetical protein